MNRQKTKQIVIVIDCLDMVNGVSMTYNDLYAYWKSEEHVGHLHIYGTTTHPTVSIEDEDKSYRMKNGRLKWPLLGYRGYFLTTPALDFIRYLRRIQPDIIHVATPGPIGILAMLAAKQRRCPVLYTHHTTLGVFIAALHGPARSFASYITRTILRGIMLTSDHVIAHSPSALREAKQFGAASVELVKMGIRVPTMSEETLLQTKERHRRSLRQRFHLADNETVLIFAGRLSQDKNIIQLLTFIEYMDWHIIFVGDGPLRTEIEMSEHAWCTGFVYGEELSSYYYGADVLINISREETLGRTLYEALAHGTPLIVSNSGHHLSELPQDSEFVLLLDTEMMQQKESVSLVNKYLKHILGQKEEIAHMSRDYAKRYCWTQVIRQHADIYRLRENNGNVLSGYL